MTDPTPNLTDRDPRMSITIPAAWQEPLKVLAAKNFRSLGREILLALSKHYEQETGTTLPMEV
jgi:hypothetical protein